MRMFHKLFMGNVAVLLSLSAQATLSTHQEQLLALLEQNAMPDFAVKEVLDTNIPKFQEMVEPTHQACLGEKMTLAKYNGISEGIAYNYVESLSEPQVNHMIMTITPFTGDNSIKSIFTKLNNDPTLNKGDFVVLQSDEAQVLFGSPNYEMLRQVWANPIERHHKNPDIFSGFIGS